MFSSNFMLATKLIQKQTQTANIRSIVMWYTYWVHTEYRATIAAPKIEETIERDGREKMTQCAINS